MTSMDSNPKITLNSGINPGNTIPVFSAISKNIPMEISAFVTTPFVNEHFEGESVGRALSVMEIASLKKEILKVIKDFKDIIAVSNISGEQLQLAKVVYIYNYILSNVSYANVLSANDGTGRVQNRIEDRGIPYESAFTALVKKKSICCGISDAVYLLCKMMGIECEKWLWPNGGHAFNKVKIGKNWYKLDATMQIGLYPGAKADEWNNNHFLTATEQNGFTSNNYSRDRINRMKNYLSNLGVNFMYSSTPKIEIYSKNDGLGKLVEDYSNSLDEKLTNINNINKAISQVDELMNSNPKITIFKRNDYENSKDLKINYSPDVNKIEIFRVNYKINIISVNKHIIINTETKDNNQQTFIVNRQGVIVGILKRGFEFLKCISGDDLNEKNKIKLKK